MVTINMIKKIFKLAIHYIRYYKVISIVLMITITISIFLPMFTVDVSKFLNEVLMKRAKTTPIVIGGKGAPLQIVLNTLYFKSDMPNFIKYKVYEDISKKKIGEVIPIYTRFTAKGFHLIGTTPLYLKKRGLRVAKGYSLQMLGDAVLGYNVAKKLKLKPGDTILSDVDNLYNISAYYPLELNIAGTLQKSNSPDDNVIFIDIRTAWIIEGIGHGHVEARKIDKSETLEKRKVNGAIDIVANKKIMIYSKITPKNLHSFHFHEEAGERPITGVLVFPRSVKAGRILAANINLTDNLQAVNPTKVMKKLMKLVFNIQNILNVYFVFVILSTILFLILIIVLTLQIRKRERMIMEMIGGYKNTVLFIILTQLITVILLSFIVSKILSIILLQVIKNYFLF